MKKWTPYVIIAISIVLVGSLTIVYLNKGGEFEVETLRNLQQLKPLQSKFDLASSVGNGTGKEAYNFSKNESEKLYRKIGGVGINKEDINIFLQQENLSNLDCSWKVGENQWKYVDTGTIPPDGRHCVFNVDVSNKGNSTINIADFLGEEIDLSGKSKVIPIIEQEYNLTVEIDNRTRNETSGKFIGKRPELINITITKYKWINDTSSFKLPSLTKKSLKVLFKPRYDRYVYDINFTAKIDNQSKEFFIPEPFVDIIGLAPPNGTNMTVGIFNVSLQAEIGGDTADNKDVYIYAGNVTQPEIRDGLVYKALNVANGTTVSYNFTSLPINSSSDGLRLLLHFDNRSEFAENETQIFDFSGNKNNGSISGSVTWNDTEDGCKFGGCFEFNGSEHVNVPHNESMNSDNLNITVMAWAKTIGSPSSSDYGHLVSKGSNQVNFNLWGYRLSTGVVRFSTDDNAGCGKDSIDGSTDVDDGQWHHIVGLHNGTNNVVFIDGVQDGSTATGVNCFLNNTVDLTVGIDPASKSSFPYKGQIDDVAYFIRDLSPTEILDIYRLRAGNYSWYVNASNVTGGDSSVSDVRCLSSDGGCPSGGAPADPTSIDVFDIVFNETSPQTFGVILNNSANVTAGNSTVDTVVITLDNGRNVSVVGVDNISFSGIINNLPAGQNQNFTWWANNSEGDVNDTEKGMFNITEATPVNTISILSNNTEYGDLINISGTTDGEGVLQLFVENTNLTSKLALDYPYTVGTNLNGSICTYGTQNYSTACVEAKFNVTAKQLLGNLTINETTNANVTGDFPTQTNVTFIVNNGTGHLFKDGTDVGTSDNKTLGAGTHIYKLNITVPNANFTENTSARLHQIVINQQSITCTISVLPNGSLTYGTEVNISGSCTGDNPAQLFVLGTNHTSNLAEDVNYTVGTNINITILSFSNTNQSFAGVEFNDLNITAFQIEGDMLINGALNSNQSFTYDQQTQVSANSTGGTVALFQDGTSVANPHNRTLGVATYIYKSNGTVATANFTQNISMQIHSVTIDQGSSATNLLLDSVSANKSVSNGTIIDVNATASNTQGNLQIFVAEVLNQTGTSPIGASRNFTGFGLVNVTACYAETTNYTRTCETHFVNITTTPVDDFPTITTLIPANDTSISIDSQVFEANVSDDINLFNLSFYWNGAFNESTNVSGLTNSSSVNISNIAPSNNTWRFVVCDNNDQCTTSAVRALEVFTADTTPPDLIWNTPTNGSTITSSNSITFDFNASDDVGLQNISLLVNGLFQQTETSLTNNLSLNQSFAKTINNGFYNMSLRLVDTSNNINNSDIRVINISVSTSGGESDSSLLTEITLIFYGTAFVLFFFSNKLRDIHSAFKWILSMIAIILLIGGIGTAVILADNLVTTQVSASSLADIQEKIAIGYKAVLYVFWFLLAYLIMFQVLFPSLLSGKEELENKKTNEADMQRRY